MKNTHMPRSHLPTTRASACLRLRLTVVAALAALSVACGGDDGGGNAVSVSGKATFDSVPYRSGGSLNYAGVTSAPIRGATVELVDNNNAVVASATSDAQGNYALSASSAASPVRVRVLAQLKGTNFNYAVHDNTDGGSMWGMESASFTAGSGITQNAHAPSGWGGSSYTGARVAGPFAILDMAYVANQKLGAVAPSQVFLPLTIYWSPNNRPVGGNLEAGEIGTSFFTEASTGERALFLLGAEDSDTDEYDTAVVAHEIGHYLQSVISRDDSLGGSHSAGDRLDMRVAFSEGWGYAWSSIVRDDPISFDSRGPQQAQGFDWSVATVPPLGGWYTEDTVQYLIWNDYRDSAVGLGGIYAAMADLRDAPYFSSIFSYNAALRTARPGSTSSINARSASVGVNGTDGYGSGETNSGGVAAALPVYGDHTAVAQGTPRTYCMSVSASIGSPNKLNNYAFVRFNASGARTITVARSGSTVAATDPDVKIISSTGEESLYATGTANIETINVSLPSGTHVMAIHDYVLLDSGSAGQRCFDVTIN